MQTFILPIKTVGFPSHALVNKKNVNMQNATVVFIIQINTIIFIYLKKPNTIVFIYW